MSKIWSTIEYMCEISQTTMEEAISLIDSTREALGKIAMFLGIELEECTPTDYSPLDEKLFD